MEVRAQACRDTLIQHRMVMATLLSTDCLLLQPRAEWNAGHLGIGALQIGSWDRQEQENWEHGQPSETLGLPHDKQS